MQRQRQQPDQQHAQGQVGELHFRQHRRRLAHQENHHGAQERGARQGDERREAIQQKSPATGDSPLLLGARQQPRQRGLERRAGFPALAALPAGLPDIHCQLVQVGVDALERRERAVQALGGGRYAGFLHRLPHRPDRQAQRRSLQGGEDVPPGLALVVQPLQQRDHLRQPGQAVRRAQLFHRQAGEEQNGQG